MIDADNFKVFLHNLQDAGAEHVSFENLHKFLDEEPTAYDVDKVVYQLEKEYKKYYGDNWNEAPYLVKSIEIVKGGGVDGQHRIKAVSVLRRKRFENREHRVLDWYRYLYKMHLRCKNSDLQRIWKRRIDK